MEQLNQSYLETQHIIKLMRKYTIPCIISLLVGALYNIVDQIFIANASYLGSFGNAANTVVFPLMVIALAISVMIGDGSCAFISLSLGKKKPKDASSCISNAIILIIIASLILTLIYMLFDDQIIKLFGGTINLETFNYAKEYFFYICLGIPFYMFAQALNPIIRADGSPKLAMLSILGGAILNIILDPIFIFVFKLGMKGAAIATIIGQIVSAIFSAIYLFHCKTVHISKDAFLLKGRIILKTLSLGLCSFLAQISLVIAMATINNMIKKYGMQDEIFSQPMYAQIPMAVVGIVMKVFQIVISIVIGMAAGCIPIVGYNIGAKLISRVRKLFTLLLIYESILGLVAFLIVELCPKLLIGIFGSHNESIYYTQFAIKAFRIYLCMIVLACINKATFIFLQAMGKPIVSTLLSMIREIIFGVGFAIILPHFFGLDGVLYSMPAADICTAVFSGIVIFYTYKSFHKQTKNKIII